MQNIQSKTKTLIRVRNGGLALLFFFLVSGIALIGIGAATQVMQYLIDGAVILVTSPIFLALAMMAKRKLKEVGV